MQNNNGQMPGPDLKAGFNGLYLAACGWSLTYRTFTRRDFGRDALGFPGLAGMGVMLVWGAYINTPEILAYFCAWIISVIRQRVIQHKNRLNRVSTHSMYPGYPSLVYRLCPWVKSDARAVEIEAFLVMAVGGAIAQIMPGMGLFIVGAGASTLVAECLSAEGRNRRLQQMSDAEIEQRSLAEDYKTWRRN